VLLAVAIALGVFGVAVSVGKGKILFFVVLGGCAILAILRLVLWSIAADGVGSLGLTFVIVSKLGQLMFALTILIFVYMWVTAVYLMSGNNDKRVTTGIAIAAIGIALVLTGVTIYFAVVTSRTFEDEFYRVGTLDYAGLILSTIMVASALCLLGMIIYVTVLLYRVAHGSQSDVSNVKMSVEFQQSASEKLRNVKWIVVGIALMCAVLLMQMIFVIIQNFFAETILPYGLAFGVGIMLPEFLCCMVMFALVFFTFYNSRKSVRMGGSNAHLSANSSYLQDLEMEETTRYAI
jgi:uncharacterized membrane protein